MWTPCYLVRYLGVHLGVETNRDDFPCLLTSTLFARHFVVQFGYVRLMSAGKMRVASTECSPRGEAAWKSASDI